MANIQLRIVALGDFTSVNAQLKALQTQVLSLQKSIAGVGLNANLSTQLKNIQTEFGNALVSSGNFTKQTVQLTSETEKFGQALQSGNLKLGNYFGIITGRSAAAQKSVQSLALEQVKLNNSIVQQDITKQGLYSVYTPTTINQTSKAVELATAKQNIFNLAVREGSNQLINFGKNTQWAGRQLTVGLSMPAILFGSQAVASFKAVNTELTRLQRLYGEGLTPPSQTQLNQISDQVLKLGAQVASQMGIAQSETTKVAANFAAMGKEGQSLLDVTYQAQRLSKLGALDATQATNTIVSLQNVYKVSTTDLANAVNFMSSMQKQTTMSLQDMTDAIPRVGPIMAQLGGSYKDTAVMLLAMREAGVPAAQAANALKSAFASIIAPTSAATKEFASFGINLDKIKSAGTPVQMLMSLQSALVGIAPLAREQLIDKLFGKFQFARVSALLDNFGKVGSQTQNALKVAGATNAQLATLAGQEMAQATASTTAKWQRAIEGLKASLYPIGQKILEVGTKILEFGQKIADFFNKLPGPIKSGLGILLTLGVLAGPIIMITGLFANLMGQVIKVGYSLLGVIDGSKKWKDLMTPAGIAAKTATDAFQTGLLENVTAVDTLNAALQRLITSIESINMNFSVGTGTSLLGKIEASAATEVASGKMVLPGMATGGYVPGNPSQGDVYPALLTGGEAVIPAAQAQAYAPFISSLINGKLTQHAYGIDPLTGKAFDVQRGHAISGHNEDILSMMNQPEFIAQQGGYGLTSVNRVTKGAMMGQTSWLNQLTKGAVGNRNAGPGASASTVVGEYEKMSRSGLNPMQELENNASKLGADMQIAGPELKKAYEKIISDIKSMDPNTMFGMGKGQIPLETFIEERLRPALQKINTAAGVTLDEITQNTIGTRGSGRGRSGSSGAVFYKESNSSVVPFGQSSLSPYLNSGDVHTQGKNVPNSISGKSKDYNATIGSNLINDIKMGAKQTAVIKSPSEVFENEVGAQISAGTMKGVEEGVSGPTGQSKIQSIFSKAFGGSSSTAGKAMSRFSSMGMMGKVGVGMGLGMVTQMASPLLNKLPGGNLLTDAMSGASMGAGFGVWGMAAGAAISLVTGGIKSLMNMEKQHAAESKADFTSSADAIQFMGGKLADTTSKLKDFNIILNTPSSGTVSATQVLGKNIAYTTTQLSSFTNMVKSLPKDNPLSLVVKQVSDAANSGDAAKVANQFATLQMAISNISPEQAKQLEQLILTVGGKNAGSAISPVATQIDAIKSSLDAALPDSTKFSQVIGQLVTEAANSNSMKTLDDIIKGIGASAATSAQQVQGLISYFTSTGNTSIVKLLSLMQSQGGFNGGDIAAAITAIQSGASFNFNDLKGGQVHEELKGATAAATQAKADKQKELNKLQEQYTNLTNGTTKATNASTVATQADAKALQIKQKVLDANLKSLQDLQKQTTAATSYATTKEDLKNQILMAQSTGDNLKAQLLQQELFKTTSDYGLNQKVEAAQNASDANKQKLADAQAAAQTAATVANTGAQTALKKQIDILAGVIANWKPGNVVTTVPSGAPSQDSLRKNANAADAGAQVFDPKTGKSSRAGTPGGPDAKNPTLPSPASNTVIFNPMFPKHNADVTGVYSRQSYFEKGSGNEFKPNGYVYNSAGKQIGQWASPNSLGNLKTLATGGTISGPGSSTSDSIPAMLSNGEYVINAGAVSHYGKGTFDALNARHLAKGGVARTNSSITYHKQHMNRVARHFADGGYVPSSVSGLMSLSSFPHFAAGGAVNSINAGTNVVYNVNVSVDKIDSTVDMKKAIDEALKSAESRAKMSGRISRVGV